jgi:hypothetical protein
LAFIGGCAWIGLRVRGGPLAQVGVGDNLIYKHLIIYCVTLLSPGNN